MSIRLFFLILITPFYANAQQIIKSEKNIQIQSKHSIYRDAQNNEIDIKTFLQLANTGFYSVSFYALNDSITVNILKISPLFKTIGTKFDYSKLKDINNELVILKTNQPLVVNFWSTTCKPCIEEIDSLNLLVKKYPKIKFLAITYDSASRIETFIKRKKFLYTIVPGCNKIESFYKVTAFPTHIFIDKDGIIKSIKIGRINSNDFQLIGNL